MCFFCDKIISGGKLKRHIKTHKSNEEVSNILKKSIQEQNRWIKIKRREGMYKYNLTHLDTLSDERLMRERKPKNKDQVMMCVECKRFISNRTFITNMFKC